MQTGMTPGEHPAEYHPELIPRRGEVIAWVTAAITGAAWILLAILGAPVHPALKLLAIILVLCGLAISLGNWMDRHTLLLTGPEGIEYQNGLRHVRLRWDEIRQVQVFPSNWGNQVRVIGAQAYFSFRTFGQVEVKGEVKGQMGFAQGDQILKLILEQANLKQVEESGQGYYYAPK